MEAGLSVTLEQKTLIKTAFLSYHISMYTSVSTELGYRGNNVTADEIYNFIQDLKHEEGRFVPDITREDIKLCFHLLHLSGVCKT